MFTCDKLLILGSSGAILLPFLIIARRKFILNVGGIELNRPKWGRFTSKFVQLSQYLGIKFSNIVIADNQHIVDYIFSRYNCLAKLVEYGGDHPTIDNFSSDLIYMRYPFLREEYYLSISRAQVDNNLHLLLEAFSLVPNRKLVLISNWESSVYGQELKSKYKNIENIFMLDAIYDSQILTLIRSSCFAYIHSHTLCGTAPSLVEVMILGKHIISVDVETNHETTENQACYFKSIEDLVGIIVEDKAPSFVSNGSKMKEISNRRYTWDLVAEKYFNLFVER